MNRCVMTIAVGTDYYLDLAKGLLDSFLLRNSSGAAFLLLTDNPPYYADYNGRENVIIKALALTADEKSFTSKFRLFENAIADENLFIDCDCLMYRDPDPVFDFFKEKNFSAIGNTITEGEFFCNVKQTIEKFNIPALP